MSESDSVVLRLTRDGRDLFTSSRKWLHPLLDLTDHLDTSGSSGEGCELYDKIVGRAAALLIVRLCVTTLRTDILSRRAIPVLDAHGVSWSAATVVDRIDCQTEESLACVDDPEYALAEIRARAARAEAARANPAAAPPTASAPAVDRDVAVDIVDATVRREAATILESVSLRVDRGERVLITGVNGAGKTTLLRAIVGVQPLDSGSVTVAGIGAPRANRRVGYVNQQSVHVEFPISVREVVEIGLCTERVSGTERRQRVAAAMADTGIAHLASRLYATLSGGEKQRTAIARCLCQRPEVLLLDEPTASLDAAGKREFIALIERLNSDTGITVLLVTHEIDTIARFGWRHLVIDGGRLATPELS
ncbi:MAG: DUF1893 domain-containing protein [Spirochaetaceae bacterium]|nr:MAG: DUF1893 domain-containing protein [Spirochaetaceae bacterium]